MRRDDTSTLTDIANACRLVIEFTENFNIDSFLEDQKTQSAVMHQIRIIGEAGKRLSPEFRSEHSEVPWKQITGMRDFLIHAYDYVDIERVWGTAITNVSGNYSGCVGLREKLNHRKHETDGNFESVSAYSVYSVFSVVRKHILPE